MKKLLIFALLISSFAYGQTIDSLYKQADRFRDKYTDKYYYGLSDIKPVNESHSFWYLTRTPKGSEFFR